MVIYNRILFKTDKAYRLRVLEQLMKFKRGYVLVLPDKVVIAERVEDEQNN